MVQTLSWGTWAGTHKQGRELSWFEKTWKESSNFRCILWGTRCYWCELGHTL